VASAWDKSDDLQSVYLLRVIDFHTLYFILYYYFHRFSISGLFVISCHPCRYFLKHAYNIIIFTHIYYIIIKIWYQYLGPVWERRLKFKAGSKSVLSNF
jgi:hypothetical protein